MHKLILIPVILSLFIACEPPATFDKPQPDETKSLNTFPSKINGDYLSADKASILSINTHTIVQTYDYDLRILKDSLDNTHKLQGDILLDINTGEKTKVIFIGDTIKQHIHWIDTLFSISENNVLKKYKGYYFLNSLYKTDAWTVRKLSLHKGQLMVAEISNKTDIANLRELTEIPNDTSTTHFSLTKQQFKKFVTRKGFSDEEVFTRIAK